jgi:hypothetical protein
MATPPPSRTSVTTVFRPGRRWIFSGTRTVMLVAWSCCRLQCLMRDGGKASDKARQSYHVERP